MKRLALALVLCLAGLPATAQVFPSDNGTPIIDDAGLIPDADEARLISELARVKTETGAEVWVVTLINTALYTGGEDVAAYAALLFAELGLTEVPAGKAAMLLVFAEDRELRIEVGQAYSTDQAAVIVSDLILPAFREEQFAQGITAGVQGMIGQLVSPVPAAAEPVAAAEPDAAPAAGGGGNALYWVLGVIAAGVAGIVAMVKRSAARLAATPCTACGKTGLTRASVVLVAATEKSAGQGETRTTCPHCGHVDAVPYAIARKDRPDGPDKAAPKTKGGKDAGGGGGASGSW